MSRVRNGLLCTALVSIAAPAAAAVPSMTLEEALSYASAHQPQIRRAIAEYTARLEDARVPRARWLPQVGATAQLFVATNNNSSSVFLGSEDFDLPRTGGTPGRDTTTTRWTPSASTLAGISLNQEVYDFGRIAAQSAIADANAAIARADVKAAALDVAFAVEEAFHGVLAAKAVSSATEDAAKRAATHRDFAQAGTKSGLRPPIDLTRAQADVALLDVRLVRARSSVDVARAALAAALGYDAIEVDAVPLSSDESPSPGLENVLRAAARDNPFVAAAIARLDAQRAATREITRELLPDLFASAGLSGRAGGEVPSNGVVPYGDGWLPDVANWHVGAVLGWKLFDGTVLARRRAAAAREHVAQADLELVHLSITLGAARAHLELEAALKALPGLTASVAAARANQAQADARFKAGLGTVVELADAETLLTNAELELALGEYGIARARAALGRAMGTANRFGSMKTP